MDPLTWLLLLGGAGAFYFVTKDSTTNSTTSTTAKAAAVANPTAIVSSAYPFLVAGAPPLPSTWQGTNASSNQYYLSYIYPAMVAYDANMTNANYTLTTNEANQYMSNYLDIYQYVNAPSTVKKYGSAVAAAQNHWKVYGVAEKRTFLPLLPRSNVPFSGGSSSSSSGWLSDIVPVLTDAVEVVASVAGPSISGINESGIVLIMESSAITKKMLPFFANVDPNAVALINNNINSVLTRYGN